MTAQPKPSRFACTQERYEIAQLRASNAELATALGHAITVIEEYRHILPIAFEPGLSIAKAAIEKASKL